MKPLDDELRSLFKRKEPPEDFAERVLAQVDAAEPRLTLAQRLAALLGRPTFRWAAAGALVCAMIILGVVHYQHQRRIHAQAEQASRQAILALRITNAELEAALQRAQRVTVRALRVPGNQSEKRSDL